MSKELSRQLTPDGYVLHGHLFGHLQQKMERMGVWRQMLWMNLLALIPLAGGLLILWLPYQFYLARGTRLALFADPSLSPVALIVTGSILLLSSIILHELIHGIVLHLAGHPPRFFIRLGVPHAAVPQGHFLTRQQYLFMALAPVVFMTSAGGLFLLILPASLGKLLLITLLLNAAASVGDLYVAQRVRLVPSTALFAAGKGIEVFVPRHPYSE
jgi:hypothetical protein